MLRCQDCYAMTGDESSKCTMCGGSRLKMMESLETETIAKAEEQAQVAGSLKQETMVRAQSMKVFTVMNPTSVNVLEELGLVFGNSSKQAFWGFSTQANRLSMAYDAALFNLKYDAAVLGADAVVGVHFALNNSTGSSGKIAGSSEAVMLLGTAVKSK